MLAILVRRNSQKPQVEARYYWGSFCAAPFRKLKTCAFREDFRSWKLERRKKNVSKIVAMDGFFSQKLNGIGYRFDIDSASE